MKNLLLTACLLLLTNSTLAAQILHLSDQDEILLDNSHLQFLHDKNGDFEFADVQSLDESQYFRSPKKIPAFATEDTGYWVKFTIHNPNSEIEKRVLVFGYSLIERLEFFIPEPDGYKRLVFGSGIVSQIANFNYRLPAMEINVLPGMNVFYLKEYNRGLHQFPLQLFKVDRFYKHITYETYKLSFLFGILAVMAFYNLFIGYTTRNYTYFYYVGYIFSAFAYYFCQQGHSRVFLKGSLSVWANTQGIILWLTGICCFAAIFSIQFLNLSRRHPAFTWAIFGSASSSVLAFLSTYYNMPLAYNIVSKSVPLTCVSILAAGFYCCYRRFRPAYYFTFAWAIFLLGSIGYAFAAMGILPWNDSTRWSLFYGSCFEVLMLSLALGDKLNYMQQKAALEIQNLNESLEKKVEEKTRDVKTLLHSRHLGIMAIVGPELLIDREYSPYLNEILEEAHLEGKKALPLLFHFSDIGSDQQARVEQSILACLGEDILVYDMNSGNFPIEMNIMNSGKPRRCVSLDWTPVLDVSGKICKMLVTCKDITEMKNYIHVVRDQESELTIISQIMRIPSDRFHRFQYTTGNFLDENAHLIQSNLEYNREAMKIIFINIHTIKGSSRALGLLELADKSHALETYLGAIQQGEVVWHQSQVMQGHHELKEILHRYVHCNEKKLNRTAHQFEFLQLHRKEAKLWHRQLMDVIQELPASLQRDRLSHLEEQLTLRLHVTLESILLENAESLNKIAKDLGKELPRLLVTGGEGIYLTIEAAEALIHSFVHIIRNAMDHGIESAKERITKGKVPTGTLEIHASCLDKGLHLTIRDDGKGLALRKIQEIAIQRGLLNIGEKRPATEIAQMVFESGFSTSSEVSEISGRGMGMHAIKRYLDQVNGKVELKILQVNPSFTDFVPFSLVIVLSSDSFRKIDLTPIPAAGDGLAS